jgi:DNA/RNA-binding domain of Phe-tRNA-synthetase-like protein
METRLTFDDDESLKGLSVGVVEAKGLDWAQAASAGRFDKILAEAKAKGEALVSAARKAAVRSMLRHGAYKPAGRAKPSSEYLLQALMEEDFPTVNYFVDAVNVVSLVSGYPISIIDLEKSSPDLLLRRASAGENYVFNAGGQMIDLADLLCVCRRAAKADGFGGVYTPTANPVRDSMATKLFPGAASAVAFIYAPAGSENADLESACARLAAYLGQASAGAEWRVIAIK